MTNKVQLNVELDQETAEALADYCRRFCFADLRSLADDDDQAYRMRNGLLEIQRCLATAEHNPGDL
ncbi:hypothetical protein EUZ85_19450 [Hahella sp. KA22]|uniref:Uncharacterized protein n=1 Tax=Hahella chejuensis (strain KCTC 2396) TaxID=349521 RepID=Q2SI87_HAHCH|nr:MULTISPECIES: hypothetical protein [Hahella]ABC29637.1 hypothetical protein HCH_02860 [Hahella chejuensis KCTC 2396]AZZ92780.1 hypothetical protein ENC22_16870 [Hahella sp. KA22]MBU6954569.1 hypothetical protein [Hahella sp. HN01]QAY56154.1 hypothetical protein EUZ85_19450 [Hahella sp. KA22]